MARKAKSELVFEIRADDKASGSLRGISQGLGDVDSKQRSVAESSSLATAGFVALGAAASAAIYKMVSSAADAEKRMANVATLIKGDSRQAIAELQQVVSNTAVEFGVLHSELGTQAYRVYSAGIKDVGQAQEILATGSSLALTAVGSLDDAMKVLIDSLRSYSQHGLEAGRAAGIIHNAIRIGITDLSQFGPALSRVTTLAEASSISFESLATGVAALTSTGLETTEAVTWMRGAIVGLTRPSEDLDMVMEHISEAVGENITSFKELVTFFEGDVVKAFQAVYKSVDGNEQALIKLVGRIEGTQGLMALADTQGAVFKAYADGMSEIGNAVANEAEALRKQQETFQYQWDRIQRIIDDLIMSMGQELVPLMKQVLEPAHDILTAVRGWPEGVKSIGAEITLLLGTIATLKIAVMGVKTAWGVAGVVGSINTANNGIGTMIRNTNRLRTATAAVGLTAGAGAVGTSAAAVGAGAAAGAGLRTGSLATGAAAGAGLWTGAKSVGGKAWGWVKRGGWLIPAWMVNEAYESTRTPRTLQDDLKDQMLEDQMKQLKETGQIFPVRSPTDILKEQGWKEDEDTGELIRPQDQEDSSVIDDFESMDLGGLDLDAGSKKSSSTSVSASRGMQPLVLHGLFNELIAISQQISQHTSQTNMILQDKSVGMGDQSQKQAGVNL